VELGPGEGLKNVSCVNLCTVFTVRQSDLRTFVGSVGLEQMQRVCRALGVACACD
jgi:mRNA-degrading endonuclease toxin of MazEF toxin-antitoxin module